MSEPVDSFGEWVQRRRRSQLLTQAALAQRVGIATVTLQKIERGERRPSLQVAELLSEHLDIAPAQRDTFLRVARGDEPIDRLVEPDAAQHTALPAMPSSLVGRAQEQADLRGLLADTSVRLLTLTGPGGVGKTRLAIAAAAQAQGGARFQDLVFWVDLAPVQHPSDVAAAILARLGIHDSGALARDQLLRWLAPRRLLLVLDNCEHLLPAHLTADMLRVAPQVCILATSRAALRLAGEHEYAVDTLEPAAAAQLFAERARAVRHDLSVERDTARAICARLDGLPLAIELAAAHCKLFTPAELLEYLTSRGALALPVGGPRDLPARQQTMHATIAWSYNLLAPEERALLARLGVFVGSFGREAARAIADGWQPFATGQEQTVAATLAALVDYSLVRAVPGPGATTRFMLLETVREFALQQLAERRELDAAYRRHAAYCAVSAEAAEPHLAGHAVQQARAQLVADMPNMRAAMRWACAAGAWELAARISTALCELFLLEQTLMIEGVGWLRACLEHADELPDGVRAWAGIGFGRIQGRVRPDAWIGAVIEDSLAISRRSGDQRAFARAMVVRSEQAWRGGDLAAGQADAREGLARARAADDPVAESWGYFALGWILGSAGELAGAHDAFEQGLAVCRRIGYAHATADMLLGLAEVAFLRGSLIEAQAHTRARLQAEQQVQNTLGIASCYEAAGILACSMRNDLAAIEQFSEALEHYDMWSSPFAVQARAWLSMAAALHGDLGQAVRYGRSAFEGMRRAHEPASTLTSRERDVAGLAAAAAALALGQGRPEISIRLCAALEHAGVELSTLMNASPADRPFRERIATLARERLADRKRFEQVCAAARHLTLDQIELETWRIYAGGE